MNLTLLFVLYLTYLGCHALDSCEDASCPDDEKNTQINCEDIVCDDTICCEQACNIDTLNQDLILMVDYSNSISTSEWTLLLSFASDIVTSGLPDNSRVAGMGFGRSSAAQGWYFGYTGLQEFNGDSDGPILNPTDENYLDDISNLVEDWPKIGGSTYLEAGLEHVLEDQVDNLELASDDTTKLMIILTDGNANDDPCTQKPALDLYGIKVVVIGIGNGFTASKVSCLVASDSDIIEVEDFDTLDAYLNTISTITCQADQNWVVSEVKPGSASKFIEITNIGADFNGASGSEQMVVTSNLLANTLVVEEVIAQGDRVVIGTDATMSACGAGCHYFQATFSTEYTSAENLYVNWNIKLEQEYTEESQIFTINEVAWDGSFPILVDNTYSFELQSLGYDNSLGSSWRPSCEDGGSPSVTNVEQCPTECDNDAQCNPGLAVDDYVNTCDETIGCDCSEDGYYTGTSTCSLIPVPSNCNLYYNDHPAAGDSLLEWTAAPGSKVYGYEYILNDGNAASVFPYYNASTSIYIDYSSNYAVSIRTIGQYASNDVGDITLKEVERTSSIVDCTIIETSFVPTEQPSFKPTDSPTEYQPLVLLAGFKLDDDNEPVFEYYDNEDIIVQVRVTPSPTFEVTAHWQLLYQDSVIEENDVIFPPNPFESGADIQNVVLSQAILDGIDSKEFEFRVMSSTAEIPNDPDGRDAYLLYEPYTTKVIVYKFIDNVPTMTPTEYQPLALLAGFAVDENNQPRMFEYYDNEQHRVQVRITPSPLFRVNVTWELRNYSPHNNGSLVESGVVSFPPNPFAAGADIQDVVLANSTLPATQTYKRYTFSLLTAEEFIPDDPNNRNSYILYEPYTIDVQIETAPTQDTVIETQTEEKLDWWLILIIVAVCVGVIAMLGLVLKRKCLELDQANEDKANLEEENQYLEAGTEEYFAKAGIHNVVANPMHNKDVNLNAGPQVNNQVEMIQVDDEEFIPQNKREFGQRQLEDRGGANAPPATFTSSL